MLCRIADLIVEVPVAGGMDERCRDYLIEGEMTPDIIIKEEEYSVGRWKGLEPHYVPYMDSGWLFYGRLLRFGGLMLHSSALELDGGAYLFSGPSGIGKSTHTSLWMQEYPEARLFNDDKPALRLIDGVWYAYGTPWAGKHGININMKTPLRGICFLRRGSENSIRRLSSLEAVAAIITQTMNRFKTAEGLSSMTTLVDKLVREIPVWEITCLPDAEAAHLSHDTMIKGDK